MDFMAQVFLGNTLEDWLLALLVFLLTYAGYGLIKRYLLRRLSALARRADKDLDVLIGDLLGRTKAYLVFFLALYLASLALTLSPEIHDFLRTLAVVVLMIQLAFWGLGVIDYLVQRRIEAEPEEEAVTRTTMSAVSMVAKIVLWSIVVLLILENVTGIELNSLIATLGIAGVAVALAVQNILGDLLSSVSIAFDKPFVIGDSITVGEFSGTVEHIGLKSTRIRSVSGEQLVFSNSDLLSSRIRNFQRLERRRVAFTLGVASDTPHEKLVAIPAMLQEIIDAQENATFDRAHFKAFGDYTFDFEVVYFVELPDLRVHVDLLHAINLAICKRFADEQIELPDPTQRVFVVR